MSSDKTQTHDDRSVGGLLRELMLELTSLLRNEAALAKAEVSEKVSQIETGIVSIVASVVLVLVGLIGLMMAGINGLALIWPAWLAALAVGGAILVVGLIALAVGRSKLKARQLSLDRTTGELRKEASFARDQVR